MNISLNQWLFAVKIYLSAMLAYFIAVELGYSNPYWAMVTCCVLSNPLFGALRARAVYRFIGTLAAGLISLFLSAIFINEPVILVIVTGIVSSFILTLSFADRTPRTYSYQLAGLTLMLVLVALMGQPEHMFSMVVSRVLEICIGILSVTLVDSLLQPGSSLPMLNARKNDWFTDLKTWRDDSFAGVAGHTTDIERVKLLSDVTSLSQLVSTMKYDSSIEQKTRHAFVALQQKIIVIIPRISAIGQSIQSLSVNTKQQLISHLADAQTGNINPSEEQLTIPAELIKQASSWDGLILAHLQQLFTQHSQDWSELLALVDLIEGKPSSNEALQLVLKAKPQPLPADLDLMLRMFAAILLTYSSLSVIWYFTGWNQGPYLVLLGVVAVSFFGSWDEPGASITNFGKIAFFSSISAFILGYGMLPLANSYSSFLIVMAIYMIPMGIWATKNPLGILALALSLSTINFQNEYTTYSIDVFLEASIASLIGVYVAFVSVAIFRRWGAAQALRLLLKREERDEQHLNQYFSETDVSIYAARSLDRMSLQMARLGVAAEAFSLILLARLRANVYAARLRQLSKNNPNYRYLEPMLELFAQKTHVQRSGHDELLRLIDSNLNMTDAAAQHLLTGLRIALFPTAPHWSPAHD